MAALMLALDTYLAFTKTMVWMKVLGMDFLLTNVDMEPARPAAILAAVDLYFTTLDFFLTNLWRAEALTMIAFWLETLVETLVET